MLIFYFILDTEIFLYLYYLLLLLFIDLLRLIIAFFNLYSGADLRFLIVNKLHLSKTGEFLNDVTLTTA